MYNDTFDKHLPGFLRAKAKEELRVWNIPPISVMHGFQMKSQ